MEPERVVDCRCHTGEGPLWHPDRECLFWVDIPDGELYRYDPAADDHELVYETTTIGGATIQADGSLLLFEDGGRVERWDDGDVTTVVPELPDERDSRCNDVIADPEGRVFVGTMPTDERGGRLYRLDRDGSFTRVREDLAVPNGMGFSPDGGTLYLAESQAQVVHRFDYDADTGAIEERSPLLEVDGDALPDGLTVDADGDVWIAFWNGRHLGRYAADGTERERVQFPARKVSSVAFAGPEYDDAYVTTALGPAETDPGTRDEEGDGAGALFRIDPATTGRPEYQSRIDVESAGNS